MTHGKFQKTGRDDGAKAAGFFLLHAALFILVPLVVAGIAVWWQFG